MQPRTIRSFETGWRILLLIGLLQQTEAVGQGALVWEKGAGFRNAAVEINPPGKVGFTSLAPGATGVNFTNVLPDERGLTNQILFSGSGVAAGDVDGDGWCDLYFCSLDGTNVLYRNLGGWKFQAMTAEAGVSCAGQSSTGAAFADIDGDGDLDLLVTGIGAGVRLFINDGRGRFSESTEQSGLADRAGSTSLALADIDGDGDLDLYVANYRTDTLQDHPNTLFRISTSGPIPRVVSIDGQAATDPAFRGRYTVDPVTMAVLENGEPDALFINNGGGRFTRVRWTEGRFLDEDGQRVREQYDWGLSVMFRDFTGDGAPDIYVCNDGDSIDRIWVNDGTGRFRAIPRLAVRKTCFSSMGVDFADVNRDGFDDIYVTDMSSYEHAVRHSQMVDRRPRPLIGRYDDCPGYMQNTLFLNRGDGTYAETAQLSGVDASDWSWMPLFLDVDLDGFEDLLITTGLSRNFRDSDGRRKIELLRAGRSLNREELTQVRRTMPALQSPNFAFRNRGDLTFELVSGKWGFDSRQVSQGMALADLDNDGDLDVMVNCMNAPALLYRNGSMPGRVAVRLRGKAPNTRGIGARIKVRGGPVEQSQEMICGGRYLSADDGQRTFATGALTNQLTIEVNWRSGQRSVVTNAKPNRIYEIDEETAAAAVVEKPAAPVPLLRDVSNLLQHRHQEEPFDDFGRQPLLSKDLSRLGPGAAWFDVDGNGWDDLILGSGRGGQLTIYLNQGSNNFTRLDAGEFMGTNLVDQEMVLGWNPSPDVGSLLIALSNYEGGGTNVPTVVRYDIGTGGARLMQALPGQSSSSGALALGDLDGDGDLDLFVGGRVVPGRYPEPASSQIYRNDRGNLRLEPENTEKLRTVGLVSSAVFTDLDGDGWPDLVLACEWGPVRVWKNQKGTLADVTQPWGLAQYQGFWNGVAIGDFDGDGRLDIAASNWGRNCKYSRHLGHPVQVYYADVYRDETVELLEAYYAEEMRAVVPWRHWDTVGRALPFVQEGLPNFQAYSVASVETILGDRLKEFKQLAITSLDSMLFLNRGGRFEARSLPVEAQFAPAFGINALDLDGDGREDLVLSQNFFEVDAETGRHDAGRGLVLRGDGRGGFTTMPGQQSGLLAYGEGRALASSDFDHDGRLDLVVTQNGADTKLYRNEGGVPGLRVRLKGPRENPAGIGATVRLEFGVVAGPAHELHAGSGYLSQDSAVQVLATPQAPTAIRVRWPGGKEGRGKIPTGAREVALDFSGELGVLR